MNKGQETRSDVSIVQVDMICPQCGEGFMNVDEKAPILTTYPAQYSHICNICGHVQNYTKRYPYLEIMPDFKKIYMSFAIKEEQNSD